MKIAVFDTGLGGEIVAKELKKSLPGNAFLVINDRANLPYGNKTAEEIINLTDLAIAPLLSSCNIVVIACNTATTIAIEELRKRHPKTIFVGFEPMIKPAVELTKTGKIAILATPATLKSQKYLALKREWAKDVVIFEPNCSDWAQKLEDNKFDIKIAQNLTNHLIDQGVDIIALACTHYIKLQPEIQKSASSRAKVINPIEAVSARLNELAQ